MPTANELDGESSAYRAARNELLQAEMDLRAATERVAEMRRSLPLGPSVDNYVFQSTEGPVTLSDLFGNHGTLIVYSFMMGPDAQQPCPMCTAFMDSLDGTVPHLEQRTAFAVVARAPIARFERIATERGWSNARLVSAHDNTYARDLSTEDLEGSQFPICNVFQRTDESIVRFWSSEMFFHPSPWHPRHVDALFPLWNLLDLTPEGRGDFFPALGYDRTL